MCVCVCTLQCERKQRSGDNFQAWVCSFCGSWRLNSGHQVIGSKLSHLTSPGLKFLRIIWNLAFGFLHQETAYSYHWDEDLNTLHSSWFLQLYQVSALGFSGYRLHCSVFILLPGLVQVGLCSSESKEFIWEWFGSRYLYNYPECSHRYLSISLSFSLPVFLAE